MNTLQSHSFGPLFTVLSVQSYSCNLLNALSNLFTFVSYSCLHMSNEYNVLSLSRALHLSNEDAVQPAVHPSSGRTLNQVQPGGTAGLEHVRRNQEGKIAEENPDLQRHARLK